MSGNTTYQLSSTGKLETENKKADLLRSRRINWNLLSIELQSVYNAEQYKRSLTFWVFVKKDLKMLKRNLVPFLVLTSVFVIEDFIEARDPTRPPPGAFYVDFRGLPIMFVRGKIPICPGRYLKPDNHFGFDTATRFSHWENCHKFWVCGHDHKPIAATCPSPQYFNPDTQFCE